MDYTIRHNHDNTSEPAVVYAQRSEAGYQLPVATHNMHHVGGIDSTKESLCMYIPFNILYCLYVGHYVYVCIYVCMYAGR